MQSDHQECTSEPGVASSKQAVQLCHQRQQRSARAPRQRAQWSTVEQVLAKQDHAEYGNRYLIPWSGADGSGNEWKCSWEKQADMDCDERVAGFMMASGPERVKRWKAALALGIVDVLAEVEAEDGSEGEDSDAAVAVTECYACAECCRKCAVSVAAIKDSVDVTTIQFDISSDWEGSLIPRICKTVGIKPGQVVLV